MRLVPGIREKLQSKSVIKYIIEKWYGIQTVEVDMNEIDKIEKIYLSYDYEVILNCKYGIDKWSKEHHYKVLERWWFLGAECMRFYFLGRYSNRYIIYQELSQIPIYLHPNFEESEIIDNLIELGGYYICNYMLKDPKDCYKNIVSALCSDLPQLKRFLKFSENKRLVQMCLHNCKDETLYKSFEYFYKSQHCNKKDLFYYIGKDIKVNIHNLSSIVKYLDILDLQTVLSYADKIPLTNTKILDCFSDCARSLSHDEMKYKIFIKCMADKYIIFGITYETFMYFLYNFPSIFEHKGIYERLLECEHYDIIDILMNEGFRW